MAVTKKPSGELASKRVSSRSARIPSPIQSVDDPADVPKIAAQAPEIFPGIGGYLRFLPTGAVFFIPRAVLEKWTGVEIEVDERNETITLRNAKAMGKD